jgi:hypothetical protein
LVLLAVPPWAPTQSRAGSRCGAGGVSTRCCSPRTRGRPCFATPCNLCRRTPQRGCLCSPPCTCPLHRVLLLLRGWMVVQAELLANYAPPPKTPTSRPRAPSYAVARSAMDCGSEGVFAQALPLCAAGLQPHRARVVLLCLCAAGTTTWWWVPPVTCVTTARVLYQTLPSPRPLWPTPRRYVWATNSRIDAPSPSPPPPPRCHCRQMTGPPLSGFLAPAGRSR